MTRKSGRQQKAGRSKQRSAGTSGRRAAAGAGADDAGTPPPRRPPPPAAEGGTVRVEAGGDDSVAAGRDLKYSALGSNSSVTVSRTYIERQTVVHPGGNGSGPAGLPELPPPPALGAADLTGRAAEFEELLAFLDPDARTARPGTTTAVASVQGMGGVGKTTLALAVAHTALDRGLFTGALFLDLRGYDDKPLDPSQALVAMLHALGTEPAQIPSEQQDRAGLYRAQLSARTRAGERVLVVADNAASAGQVEHLVPGTGPNRLLITSRDDLSALGARLFDLDVLTGAAAVELLDGAVRATLPGDGRIAADPSGAARVAELCGHLPLALRLAAAQLVTDRALKPAALAAELEVQERRLDALDDGRRAIRTVLETSCRRLTPPQAELFCLLTFNPGPDMSTAVAMALSGTGKRKEVRARLIALARASLIRQDPATDRWSMHDLVRLYAIEQLGARRFHRLHGGMAASRLLRHYADHAEAAAEYLTPEKPSGDGLFGSRAQAMEWLDVERMNLVGAVRLAHGAKQYDLAQALAVNLGEYFNLRRYLTDWLAVASTALDSARAEGDRRSEAAAGTALARVLTELRRFEEAEEAQRTALDLLESDDREGRAAAWAVLGQVLGELRRFEEGEEALRTALDLLREVGNRSAEATVWNNLGQSLLKVRRFEEAEQALRTALTVMDPPGNSRQEATIWTNLGVALHDLRRFPEAEEAERTALRIAQELGDGPREGTAWNNLGHFLQDRWRLEEAEQAQRACLEIFEGLGDRFYEGTALSNLGSTLLLQRRLPEAEEAARAALAVLREVGDSQREGAAWSNLGRVLAGLQRFEEAEQAERTALEMLRAIGDRCGEATAASNLGTVLHEQRLFEEAEELHRAAVRLCEEEDDPRNEAMARSNLGQALLELRRFEEAEVEQRAALALVRDNGDRHREGTARHNLGGVLYRVRRFEEAEAEQREALAIVRDNGDRHGEGKVLNNLGQTLLRAGRLDEAEEVARAAVAIFQQTGDRRDEGVAWNSLGGVLREAGRFDEAVEAQRRSLALHEEIGDRYRAAVGLVNLGTAQRAQGDPVAGTAAVERAVEVFRELADAYREGEALAEFASCLAALGRDPEEVTRTREAAAAAFRRVGAEEEAVKVLDPAE
ncbi:tetratricopeptide repeat protein [Kitasatospora sp. NPDC094019]|uniref:tetratricopeptide repeat protein n=1 Tax=Kitasatospora sp. NPDC094019 TaxID=3364091 RepID=UPI00380FF6D2